MSDKNEIQALINEIRAEIEKLLLADLSDDKKLDRIRKASREVGGMKLCPIE